MVIRRCRGDVGGGGGMIFYMETRAQERTMKMKVEGRLDRSERERTLATRQSAEAYRGSQAGKRGGLVLVAEAEGQ